MNDVVVTVKAENLEEAIKKAHHNNHGMRHVTARKEQKPNYFITRTVCLYEIEKNGYFMRVGPCRLTVLRSGIIEVHNWEGIVSTFTDLLTAIDAFIEIVNNASR